MTPMDVLVAEHTLIERMLSCLQAMAEGCRVGKPLDAEAARQALDFFRGFADQVHHAKEEEHLFPLLERRGLVRERGPTGVMLAEHEVGRHFLREMAAAIEARDPARFAEKSEGYIALLRAHIQKENHCLFAMADQVLSAEDRAALLDAFARQDAAASGSGALERYRRLAEALADQLQVPAYEAAECRTRCGSR